MTKKMIDLSMPHDFEVEILSERPSTSASEYSFLGEDDVGTGELIVRVVPRKGETWIGKFSPGYKSPKAITGVFACPNENQLCVVSSGQGFILEANNPKSCQGVQAYPVTDARLLAAEELLILSDFTRVVCYGENGVVWKTPDISWDGIELSAVESGKMRGFAWDAPKSKTVEFSISLRTGSFEGGSSPAMYSDAVN